MDIHGKIRLFFRYKKWNFAEYRKLLLTDVGPSLAAKVIYVLVHQFFSVVITSVLCVFITQLS
jgi:hypothetical protein